MPAQYGMDSSDALSWQSFTYVVLIAFNLPVDVRPFDIWRNLKDYGNITKISIFQNRHGGASHKASVIFKPPPQKLPLSPSQPIIQLPFICKDKSTTRIRLRLDKEQPRHDSIKSPVRENVTFDQEITLTAKSIDFGVLRRHDKMTVMRSAKAIPMAKEHGKPAKISQVKLILNLRRMELEVYFPSILYSENSVEGKVREFRFAIALDDHFSIGMVEGSEGGFSYILTVRDPPWYTRRLSDKPQISFVEDAKVWFEDDMWTRQTDVVYDKTHYSTIDQTPVALRKNMNTINLARWTTFRLNFSANDVEVRVQRTVESAMKDFSVQVDRNNDFQVEVAALGYEASYWSLLKSSHLALNKNLLSDGCSFELSFPLHYQLEVCISQGWLCEYDLDKIFIEKLKANEQKSIQILTHVDSFAEHIFDPMSIFGNIKYSKPIKARQLPSNCILTHHATVTATGVKLHTPTVEVSNRVVRKYKEHNSHFLRVRFEDDNYKGRTKLFASSNKRMLLIFDRVKRTMRHGLDIAGRHYEFLAWGNSQLREHGCYFFAAPGDDLNAQSIRAELGIFDNEKIVAKRAARLGQCFSTTQAIHLRMPVVSEDTCIPDIVRGNHNFSDGVGKISRQAAQLVSIALKLQDPVPSCFQFRMGGCKGILVVDPTLLGIDVRVRGSQFKFQSNSQELEIIRWSQFWQPFLNRQLIMVLSDLGVENEIFLKKQQEAIKALEDAMDNDYAAVKSLRDNVDPNQMTLAVADLVTSGFRRAGEPFVKQVLNLWRAWSLKYLKEKAKIPVSKGCFVLGCVDETATLDGHWNDRQPPPDATREEKEYSLPQVFVQYTSPHTGERKIVEGICIIARNPSLHLGDIRVVKAVNVPALHHLCDVLVMPQTGDRDLPSMCAGGDLDGDDYIVIWDEQLIPPVWNAEPFHYDPPPPKTAQGEITTSDIIDFFYDYLQNDFLGRIAHAHLGGADYFDDGIKNVECLELVELHSKAVDYPKTGVPAILPRRLERQQWPHFMEKRGKPYKSRKVLGLLFDHIERVDYNEKIKPNFDGRILAMETPVKTKSEMESIKHEYDETMRRIMARYKIKTEFEVWSTFVLDHSRASGDFKFHEEIGQISRALKDQYYQAIVEFAGGDSFDHLAPCAVAAYQITVRDFLGDKNKPDLNSEGSKPHKTLISFPWLLPDILGKIVSLANAQIDTKPEIKSQPQKVAAHDPFLILNPFKGVIKKGPTKAQSKPPPAVTHLPQQGKQGTETSKKGEGFNDHTLTQASLDAHSQASVGDSSVSASSKEPSIGSQSTPEIQKAEAVPNSTMQLTDLIIGEGKDPAEMTAEEMAALGLGDDDDL